MAGAPCEACGVDFQAGEEPNLVSDGGGDVLRVHAACPSSVVKGGASAMVARVVAGWRALMLAGLAWERKVRRGKG